MSAPDATAFPVPEDPQDELQSLLAIHQAITANLDPAILLQQIADDARRLTAAGQTVVFLVEGAEMLVAAASGNAPPREPQPGPGLIGARLPLAGSLAELALQSGRALRIADAESDPHVLADPRRLAFIRRTRVQTLLVVPLLARDRVIGVISASNKLAGSFSDDDERTLNMLASSAVIGLENARLYRQGQEQAKATAILEERARLARELHDSVTQALYSLTLFAEAGLHQADLGHFGRVQQHMALIGETAQQALKEMRLLVYQLRSPAFHQQGLAGALRQRLDAVEGRAGVSARLIVDDVPGAGSPARWPAAVEEGFYWIAQEALNNALKHAAASQVTVRVGCAGGLAVLRIEDNGRGFSPDALGNQGGLGLTSMSERAEQLGGALKLASAPGQGTTVTVEVAL